VRVVTGAEYERALFMDKMEQRFPLGLSLSGHEIVYGNLDFLNGRKGAHANLSGVSGVATKTTYATFLIHSLLHCGALSDPKNTHAIIFNVKGEDLLFLDKPSNAVSTEDLVMYDKMGLPPEPFDSVQFYVPPTDNPKGPIMPEVGSRRADEVIPYFWTVRSFCRERLLRYLFSEADEDSSLLSTLIYQVERRLSEAAEEADKRGPGPGVFLRTEKKSKEEKGQEGETQEAGEERDIRDFPALCRAIEVIANSTTHTAGTIGALMRRLYGTEDKIAYVIRDPGDADPARHTINWRHKQVTVVSLTKLYGGGGSGR
jgi:DNA helicase HerA-like ATPase